MYQDTTVIIPTLNEEGNVGRLLRLLKKSYPKIKIVVSDDGSTDKTQIIAKKEGARVIDRTRKKIKGLTASVVDAVKQIKTKNIVVIDADFQHPIEKIMNIVKKLRKFDVVGAKRKSKKKLGFCRRIISKVAILLGRIKLLNKNFKVKDVISGFFGIKTNIFKSILKQNEKKFEMQGYKVFFDLLKYLPKDAKVTEIGYNFRLREEGESKIRKKHIYIYLKSLFK